MALTERGQRILEYVDQELAAPEPDRRERIRQALARWMERNATGKVRRYRPNSIKSRKRD